MSRLRLIRLVPRQTRIGFIRWRRVSAAVSGALLLFSVVIWAVQGLNYGIDFEGGTLVEINTGGAVDINTLRSRLGSLDLGDVQIQRFGEPGGVLIRVEGQEGAQDEGAPDAGTGDEGAQDEGAQDAAPGDAPDAAPDGADGSAARDLRVLEALRGVLGDGVEYRRVEVVGPKVSGELVRAGVLAIVIAIMMVLVYIWIRFEWQFSAGAVAALVHDIVLTIGVFSLLQLEFNLAIIAAILTIVGYSLNDTVVVYDRVRENLRKFKKMPMDDLLDLSINQTLSRTLMTSLTTLLALFSLYIFGGDVIRGFTFAMIWGVFVGTYSSVWIASPLLLLMGVKRDWSGL